MVTIANLIIGKNYNYSQVEQVEQELADTISLGYLYNEYGENVCGMGAIHLRNKNTNLDIWFILDGTRGEEYVYKLVYKE